MSAASPEQHSVAHKQTTIYDTTLGSLDSSHTLIFPVDSTMAITSTAAASAASNAKVSRPPPMQEHIPEEFRFAERTLNKMVLNSTLFPEGADREDWFRPHDAITSQEAARRSRRSEGGLAKLRRLQLAIERAKIPPYMDSSVSIATARTSSVTSSDRDSPIVHRRSTVDDMDIAGTHGLPFKFVIVHNTIDTKTGDVVVNDSFARRHSMDNADLKSSLVEVTSPKEEISSVPSVHEKEIDYGKILGQGGFCEVRLASIKIDRGKKAESGNVRQPYAMKYLSPTKLVPKDPPKDDSKPTRNKPFERGIADLAIEARFLALLSHENIISLHYVSKGRLDVQFNSEGENNYYHQFGYFLLLDQLHESLTCRIDGTYIPQVFSSFADSTVSMKSSSGSSRWLKRLMNKNQHTNALNDLTLDCWRMQLVERLECLKGVASALQYLHDDCHVIYRDLKPDNIGFYRKPHPNCHCGKRQQQDHPTTAVNRDNGCCTCFTEIPKLFDFGLAKELKPKYLTPHPHYDPREGVDTYKLTARSGSRRYMSPEVAFSTPYNEKADVYSFGIVLYQTASLVTPFEGYSMQMHEQEVLSSGERPDIKIPCAKRTLTKVRKSSVSSYAQWMNVKENAKKNKHLERRTKSVWPKELKTLLDSCWHDDMRHRPSMKFIVAKLEESIRELNCVRENQNAQPETKIRKTMLSRATDRTSKSSMQETEWFGSGGESGESDLGRCTSTQ